MAARSAEAMRKLVSKGQAMPAPGEGRPGRFPIANQSDLENAIRAIGRVKGGEAERAKVRRYVMSRARALGLSKLIPDTWSADGSLKNAS